MKNKAFISHFTIVLIVGFFFSFANTIAQTYYSKSVGNLNTPGTWGLNADGTGASPANFTTAGRTYIIVNRTTASISANWTVSGAGSKVQLGDGATAVTFSIPTTAALVGTIDVTNTATLSIQHSTIPTFGTISSGSTINYSRAGNQTVSNVTYYNLTLSGSGRKSLSNTTNTSITNALTINSGVVFRLNTANTLTCTISGNISGTGTFLGGTAANLSISGSGNLGTLTFSTTLSLYKLSVNRTSAGSLTLGSNLTVSNAFTHTNGTIDLGGRLLTLSNAITFPVAASNGGFTGSTTSSISIGTTGAITNSMYMNQTSSTTKSLGSLVLNRTGQTLALGNDLIISGRMTQTAGIINIGTSLLSLNGVITFPTTVANGSFIGTSTASLSIGGTGTITNSLFMNQTSSTTRTLNSLTLNRSAQALRLGNNLIVSGPFTHTTGTLTIAATLLTLNGAITFPSSATNGVVTGATTSSVSIGGAGTITNSLFMAQTSAATRSLHTLIMNRLGETVVLGNNLVVATAFTQTSGNIGIGSTLLTLNGAITFPIAATSGSLTGSTTSSISIGGTGAITNSVYMNQSSSTTKSMSAITLNRAGQILTLGNSLALINVLTPTAGTFASAGNLTLVASSASLTASIASIGAGASITGNVTVESFASAGTTGWTLLGSAGITGRTMADWNDDFAITCASCPNGSTVGGSPFTSITTYNEAAGGVYDAYPRYVDITNITNSVNVGTGYWVYLGNGTTTTSNIIFDVTGPVSQGNYTINLSYTPSGGGSTTDWGYNLISNPYPSPISWSLLRNSNANVADAIYVYNPDIGGFASYVAGVSSPVVGSGGIGNMIPSGQGFYVKASATTSLIARETNKATSTQALLKSTQTQNVSPSTPPLIRLKVNGAGMNNETVVYFDANAHSYYETERDAISFGTTPSLLNIVSVINNTNYAINGVEELTQNTSIPIKITTGSSASYQISAEDFQDLPTGACLMLHDNLTNTDHNLRSGPYNCTIANTETSARFILNISITNDITVTSSYTQPSCAKSNDGFIIASASTAGIYDYYWKDSSNQIIKMSINKSTADTLTDLAIGYYKVDITTSGSCSNGKEMFNLLSQNSTISSFVPSAVTAVLNNDTAIVSFNNTSTNADSYWWVFGDGNESNEVNPINKYTTVGEYPVTLLAFNSVCGDTVEYTTTIQVTTTPTAIEKLTLTNSDNLLISRDKNGYYTKFNYTEPTQAVISVWNLLGEKVKDIIVNSVTDDKIYIPLGDANQQLLIITATSSKGEKTYRKIVNN